MTPLPVWRAKTKERRSAILNDLHDRGARKKIEKRHRCAKAPPTMQRRKKEAKTRDTQKLVVISSPGTYGNCGNCGKFWQLPYFAW
jgi:hypothetical protein